MLLAGSLPVLFTLFFLFKQQVIQHMMKERLEQQHLHTITLPESEVQWVKQKKEILVQDKMFDIKSYTKIDGQYFFTGLFDEEETSLNKILEKDFDRKNESGNQLIVQLFQLLQAVYPVTVNDIITTITLYKHKATYYQLLITFGHKKILLPPPRFDYKYS